MNFHCQFDFDARVYWSSATLLSHWSQQKQKPTTQRPLCALCVLWYPPCNRFSCTNQACNNGQDANNVYWVFRCFLLSVPFEITVQVIRYDRMNNFNSIDVDRFEPSASDLSSSPPVIRLMQWCSVLY